MPCMTHDEMLDAAYAELLKKLADVEMHGTPIDPAKPSHVAVAAYYLHRFEQERERRNCANVLKLLGSEALERRKSLCAISLSS